MKKVIFSVLFMLIASGFIFCQQNYRNYTLIAFYYRDIQGAIQGVGLKKTDPVKYAVVASDGKFGLDTNPTPTFFTETYNAGGIMAFELTAAQAQQIRDIEKGNDRALILFTKIDKAAAYRTANPNFDFKFPCTLVADKIIPMKEVWGITYIEAANKIQDNYWLRTKNMEEVVKLFLETGKTDPDGRVAKAPRR